MVRPTPDWNTVTLKWAAVFLDGTPAKGSLTLEYNGNIMLDDDPVLPVNIFKRPLTVPIETKPIEIEGQTRQVGYAEFQVPASDDPDITGSGGTYTLTENLTGGGGRKGFTFFADAAAPGGVIWLNKIMPADPTVGKVYPIIYYSEIAALTDRVETLEANGGGGAAVTWSTLAGKPATFTPTTGTTAGTAAAGNDARLADARTPKAHSHPISEVTGLQAALDAKGTSNLQLGTTSGTAKAGDYQPTWAQVTGKPTTFTPATHSHTATDLSGVVKTVNGTAPDGSGNVVVAGGGGGSAKTIREVLVGEDINAALAGYEGEVRLQRGVHLTSVGIVQNRRQKVTGEGGGATVIRASAAIAGGLWRIGNGAPCDKTTLSDLTLDCDGKADYGLDINIVGTTGNYGGEPDGQCHVERLYVDDAVDIGVYVRGGDSQAYHLYGVRARRAGNYGFRIDVGGPDAWILDCEATTSNTGTGAGFLVGSSNLHFKGCKAWYCRGYGWQIKGTRNIFVDCESQDTRLHGWMIEWDKNQFIGCMADSAGYADVGGVSNTQDGFYLASGLTMTTMAGCVAFDREQGYPAQQRYGFNMSASTYNVGRAGSATAAPVGSTTVPVLIGALSGGNASTANYKNLGGLLNLR